MKRGEAAARRVVALNGETGQLLMYLTDTGALRKGKSAKPLLELDMAIIDAHPQLAFRDDVEDTVRSRCHQLSSIIIITQRNATIIISYLILSYPILSI